MDLAGNDLDTTVGHLHDFGDGVLFTVDGGGDDGGELDFLVVDGDEDLGVFHFPGGLDLLGSLLGSVALLATLLLGLFAGDELDLVFSAEEDGDGAAGVLVEVLGEDGDGVATGAILDEDVLAAGDGGLVEGVSDVVESVDVTAFKGAHGVGLGAEDAVLDVFNDVLGGGQGENGADDLVGLDVAESQDGAGLADFEIDELLVGGHASVDLHGVLLDGLGFGVLVVGHVGEESDAESVFNVLGGVPESQGHFGVLERKQNINQLFSMRICKQE